MRQRKAFTLVELLVVIGIIAVLISILMPSLSRARMSATLVACESNFKQIYTAISFYANENKGTLPAASWTNPKDPNDHYDPSYGGTNPRTFIMLSRLLGTVIDDPATITDSPTASLNQVFTCEEIKGTVAQGPGVWSPTMIRTVQFHPQAFPGYDQLFDDQQNNRRNHPFRKLSQIKNASDKIAFWEGASLPLWNATSEPESISLDGWRSSAAGWGHRFYDPVPSDATWEDLSRIIDVGQNRDQDWWVCGMRFRHMKNTVGPIGFFDGHVDVRKASQIPARDVCITPP